MGKRHRLVCQFLAVEQIEQASRTEAHDSCTLAEDVDALVARYFTQHLLLGTPVELLIFQLVDLDHIAHRFGEQDLLDLRDGFEIRSRAFLLLQLLVQVKRERAEGDTGDQSILGVLVVLHDGLGCSTGNEIDGNGYPGTGAGMRLRVLSAHLGVEHQTFVGTPVATPVVGHMERVDLRTDDDASFALHVLDVLVELCLRGAGHHDSCAIVRIFGFHS